MKKTLLYLVLTGVLMSFSSALFAQSGSRSKVLYDRNTGFYFGLNGGATYQSQVRGEIDRYAGFAGGFTFGKDWLKKDAILGWGLRYRFLAGATYGLDKNVTDSSLLVNNDRFNGNSGNHLNYKDNVGHVLQNYRTSLIDQSLELSIHLNKLRQNTGLIVSGFGGIGLTAYSAKTNQLDVFGDMYNHDANAEYGIDDLRFRPNQTLDGTFETDAAWNDGPDIDWMPTLGLELGFQLSPHAALTFVHRHTWTRRNTFDGQIYNASGENSNVNDTYYYTGLSLKWNIHRGRGSHVEPIHTNNNTSHLVVPPKKKPIVNITDPYSNPHTVNTYAFNLKAKIYNVDGAHQITFKQNGVENLNFTYYPGNNGFSSNVILKPGQNVFEIRATNEAGSDYESRVIIYADPVQTISPPIVSIKNPSYCPFVVNSQSFTVSASIFNVDSKSNVKFKVNGQYTSNFSYNPSTDLFTANLNLNEGNNIIEITGTNSAGSDVKSCNIIYEKPVTPVPPVVTIINPSLDPYTTNTPTQVVVASVLNVQSANNITVTQNGVSISGFTYNPSNHLVTINSNLQPGSNYFVVTGTNNDGSDQDATTIIYNKPQQVQPPIVSFIDPYTNPLTVYNNQYHLVAQVLHVAGANNITLKINGIPTSNFSYSTSSKDMDIYANLVPGSNVFEVTATNSDGSDYASTTIIYKKPAPQLPPVVTITSPSANPHTVSVPQATVIATVLNVNSANNIAVTVNGTSTTNFSYNLNTKVLQLNTNLVQGNNVVSITGTNQYGSDNASTTIIYQPIHNPTPPVVNITFPVANPYTTAQPHQTVLASVQNIVSYNQLDVKINGVSTGNYSFNASNGEIAINNIVLNQGSNLVSITGTNQDGTASDNTTIIYKPVVTPCDAPTVNFTNPSTTPVTVQATSNAYSFQVALTNVSSASQLDVKFNGASTTNFTYSGNSLTVPVNLQNGSNVLEVVAENSCDHGHASAAVVFVEEQLPCDEPVVNFTQPNGSTNTQNQTNTIVAQVLNVSGANDIQMLVNGQANQNFTYDLATHSLTATLTLPVGQNNIVLKATNTCGTETATVSIKVDECHQPTVNFLSPTLNATISSATVSVTANVSNVTDPNNIEMTVNGAIVAFNFNNGTLTSTVNLQVGVNMMEIKASNACGERSESIEVTRADCTSPSLSVVKPSTNPYLSNVDNIHVKAYAVNASKNDIQILLNGNSHTFQFEPGTGKIIFTNTIQEGSNTVVITVTNACGTASETITVNYEPEKDVVTLLPPDVTITNPSSAPHQASTPLFNVKGTVTNIASSNDMSVTVNGVNTSNFTYNPVNGNFNIPVTLTNGVTTVVNVVGSNSVGSDSETTSLVYKLTTNTTGGGGGKGGGGKGGGKGDGSGDIADTIVNTSGGDGTDGKDGSGVGNVADSTNTNGNGNGKGNPNGNNGHGNNQDGVDSSNPGQGGGGPNGSNDSSGGVDDENGKGNGNGNGNGSNGTALLPVITINNPSGNNTTSSMPSHDVNGTITNISSASDVEIKVNNDEIIGLNYDPTTNAFHFLAILDNGNNLVEITATNSAGSDQEVITIVYNTNGGGVSGGNGTGGGKGNGAGNGNGTGNGNAAGTGNGNGNGNGNTTGMQLNTNVGGTNTDQLSETELIEKDYKKLIKEGDDMFNRGDFDGAETKYKSALLLKGKSGEAHPKNRLAEIGAKKKEAAAKIQAEKERIRKEQEAKAKAEKEAKAKAEAERIRKEQEAKAQAEKERIRKEQEAKAKAEKEAKAKAEAERIRKEQEAKAQAEKERLRKEQEAKAKAEKEAKAKAEAERIRKEQEAKAQAEKERIRKEQEAKAKAEQEARAKAEAERKRKEAEAKAQAEKERLRKEQEAKARAEQDAKAKAEAERRRKEAEAKAQAEKERLRKEQEAKARAEQEAKARAEAERARKEQEARAKAEAERKKREQAAKAKAEQEARARAEAERKRKEAEARARAEQQARAKAEAERKRKEAEARARAEAERKRKAAEAKAKADAAAKAKAEAEKKRKAQEAAKAKAEAEKKKAAASPSRSVGGRQ